ncbi:uncharacterized protein LOC132548767 [Ylistrum balloti]|uniref:uncharacterized protein LOC132548767 n=1 Tax=Ylistrum balloti TaxID=509963 RepID=UPI002905DAEE|nr:uncharacterized protein LOC132548767 [Ylistrum balloti]
MVTFVQWELGTNKLLMSVYWNQLLFTRHWKQSCVISSWKANRMTVLLKTFRRDLLQYRQHNVMQIAAASKIRFDEIIESRKLQKALNQECLEHISCPNVLELVRICKDLDCTLTNIHLLTSIIEKNYNKSWSNTLSNVHTLKEHGYSVPQMIQHHQLFSLMNKRLHTMLDVTKNEQTMFMLPVELHNYDQWIWRYLLHAKYTMVEKPKYPGYIWRRSLSSKENVFRFFKHEGITFPKDFTRYPEKWITYESLNALLAHASQYGLKVHELDLKEINDFGLSKKVFHGSQTILHSLFYEYLQQQKLDEDVKGLILLHEKDVIENLKILEKHGFKMEDSASCPLVLCHSPEVLLVYLKSLLERKEFESILESGRNKKKTLQYVQYLIERNHRFSTQVVKTESHAALCYELNMPSA